MLPPMPVVVVLVDPAEPVDVVLALGAPADPLFVVAGGATSRLSMPAMSWHAFTASTAPNRATHCDRVTTSLPRSGRLASMSVQA